MSIFVEIPKLTPGEKNRPPILRFVRDQSGVRISQTLAPEMLLRSRLRSLVLLPLQTPGSSGAGPAAARAHEEEKVALFAPNEANDLRARWDSIQVAFVDEPRKAVQEADALVSDTIKRLSEVFGNERHNLEQQWDRNEDVSTEDLRVALRRYRSFFGRLLAI